MRKFLLLFVLLCVEKAMRAQYIYTIKADSVKITNSCDTAELIIENHTQSVPGFLFNKGRGRTEFRRGLVNGGDGIYIIGADTLDFNKAVGNQYYKQGGNQFGATGVLGLKDNYPLTFIQNNTERARIDTTGNMGIGTSTPESKLHIIGDIHSYGVNGGATYIGINNNYQSGDTYTSYFGGYPSSASIRLKYVKYTYVSTAELSNNYLKFQFGNGDVGGGIYRNAVTQNVETRIYSDSLNGYPYSKGAITFFTNGTEKARFDGDGNLGIGTSAPAAKLHLVGDIRADGSNGGNSYIGINPSYATGDTYTTMLGGHPSNNSIKVKYTQYNFESSALLTNNNLTFTFGNGDGGGGIYRSGVTSTIETRIYSDSSRSEGTKGNITFFTNGTEKARIDGNGNLGIGTNSPSATLHVTGTGRFDNTLTTTGHRSAIRNITASTTVTDTDEYIFASAGSTITVTLPSASGRDGQTYTIKKIDGSSNAVTVSTSLSQFIDGSNSYSLSAQYSSVTVVANSGNWMIVAKM